MKGSGVELEVCCESVLSVDRVLSCGKCEVGKEDIGVVKRVELCSSLLEGGLTPSSGLIAWALRRMQHVKSSTRLFVLIRPRGGDFLFNSDEVEIMEQDVITACQLGAHGVVIGALTADGKVGGVEWSGVVWAEEEADEVLCQVDKGVVRRLVESAWKNKKHQDFGVTFHRAFDLCRDPIEGE